MILKEENQRTKNLLDRIVAMLTKLGRRGYSGGIISRRDAEAQRMTENDIGTIVVDCAITIHRELGYLLNFGEVLMKAGITRCVNGLEE